MFRQLTRNLAPARMTVKSFGPDRSREMRSSFPVSSVRTTTSTARRLAFRTADAPVLGDQTIATSKAHPTLTASLFQPPRRSVHSKVSQVSKPHTFYLVALQRRDPSYGHMHPSVYEPILFLDPMDEALNRLKKKTDQFNADRPIHTRVQIRTVPDTPLSPATDLTSEEHVVDSMLIVSVLHEASDFVSILDCLRDECWVRHTSIQSLLAAIKRARSNTRAIEDELRRLKTSLREIHINAEV